MTQILHHTGVPIKTKTWNQSEKSLKIDKTWDEPETSNLIWSNHFHVDGKYLDII